MAYIPRLMSSLELSIESHPLLHARAFITDFPAALGTSPSPSWLISKLVTTASAPMESDDEVRSAVRELLRAGGYKPTGRGKPASEYLLRAAGENALSSINMAVDLCNAVSLHSGLPISVVDLARASGPFRIGVAKSGESYVFNASGQTIDLEGLLCLFDAEGPCANAVKDAQRTKTSGSTTRTLSIIWGSTGLRERTDSALAWYRDLLDRIGATSIPIL